MINFQINVTIAKDFIVGAGGAVFSRFHCRILLLDSFLHFGNSLPNDSRGFYMEYIKQFSDARRMIS